MQDSVGFELRVAREKRQLSLEEVAQVTRIPLRALQAIEEARYADLPAEVFSGGFVRTYAELLKLPVSDIVHRFQIEVRARKSETPSHLVTRAAGTMTSSTRMSIGIALVILCVVFALAFAFILSPRRQRYGVELSYQCDNASRRIA